MLWKTYRRYVEKKCLRLHIIAVFNLLFICFIKNNSLHTTQTQLFVVFVFVTDDEAVNEADN